MDKVSKRFKKMMDISSVVSLAGVILGILMLVFPDTSTKIFMVCLGALMIFEGIFAIIKYLYDGLGSRIFASELITGVASVILGVFTIFNPFTPLEIIGILVGIWLIIMGLDKFYYGVRFAKVSEEISPLVFVLSILIILMGILTMFNPFKAFMLITRLIGLFVICEGLFEVMICRLYRKRGLDIIKIFE